jgi:cytoskeletal protein CcmA (bactofilin family)
VRGDVTASRSAVLHPTARVIGNIRAPKLVIEEGARFSGTVDMEVELPAGIRTPGA